MLNYTQIFDTTLGVNYCNIINIDAFINQKILTMKKILSPLILVVLFVTSYASASEKSICVATDAEVSNGFVYLPNNIKPFTGNDLCEYKNGKIKTKGVIVYGRYVGIQTIWHENGQKKLEGSYKDGKQDGKWMEWDENGQQVGEIKYKYDKLDNQKTICIDTDAEVLNDSVYLLDGIQPYLQGNLLCEYENGQVKNKGIVKDGTLEGIYNEWFENGQKKIEIDYKNGKYNGKTTVWYNDGQKEKQENYKDGEPSGKQTAWYENGQKAAELNYKDEKLFGKQTNWFDNGQIEIEVNYKDGKRDGRVTKWYKHGEIATEQVYINDECISGC